MAYFPILAFFGIKIDKSFFGKRPKDDSPENRFLSYSPVYRMGFMDDKIDKVNVYGEGFFEPYDVVPLSDHPGQTTLSLGLSTFDIKDFQILRLGQEIKTSLGISKIFGYKFPEDWENIGIKVIDESTNPPVFAIVQKNEIQKKIHLKPLGILIN